MLDETPILAGLFGCVTNDLNHTLSLIFSIAWRQSKNRSARRSSLTVTRLYSPARPSFAGVGDWGGWAITLGDQYSDGSGLVDLNERRRRHDVRLFLRPKECMRPAKLTESSMRRRTSTIATRRPSGAVPGMMFLVPRALDESLNFGSIYQVQDSINIWLRWLRLQAKSTALETGGACWSRVSCRLVSMAGASTSSKAMVLSSLATGTCCLFLRHLRLLWRSQ